MTVLNILYSFTISHVNKGVFRLRMKLILEAARDESDMLFLWMAQIGVKTHLHELNCFNLSETLAFISRLYTNKS